MPALALGIAFVFALAFGGCASQTGPGRIPPARIAYNHAVASSADEQLLLNLVRLRYRDTPLFLDVGSITTQFSLGVAADASLGIAGNGGTAWSAGTGVGVDFSESPTVTYSPLQGEAFVTRLLSPITPATLVLLSQSGWSIERLLLCCVQRVNDLGNAVAAAGPTPDYLPQYEPLHRLADRLRQLQVAGVLRVEPDAKGELVVELPLELPPSLRPAGAEVRELLGLAPDVTELRAAPTRRGRDADELAITGRSLLAVLFFLSQGVEVPPSHAEAGLVTVTRDDAGTPFDWSRVTGRLLRVRASAQRPPSAAVAVPYRGHWFWVADDDLTSKSTFNLLSFLFALKAGSAGGREPLLTLGVG
jgi:hypothetical protein